MRAPPKVVEPIIRDNIRYEVQDDEEERFGQSGGVLSATDIGTGKEYWAVRVFEQSYDPTFERDVQEVFIRSISWDQEQKRILVIDERQRKYAVAPDTGDICQLG